MFASTDTDADSLVDIVDGATGFGFDDEDGIVVAVEHFVFAKDADKEEENDKTRARRGVPASSVLFLLLVVV